MRDATLRRGPVLTRLGVGAAQFGNLYRETTDDEAAGAVRAAWDRGVRVFDTAPHYGLGLSEKRLGALLQAYPRDQVTLSTKVGRILEPTPERAGEQDDEGFAVPAAFRRRFDLSRDGIRRSVEESLARLGMDRIDIAYLHDPDVAMAADPDRIGLPQVDEAIDALIELRDEGVVRAIGTGTNVSALPAELIERKDLDVVMIAGRYTLLDDDAAAQLLPRAQEHDVAVVAAGVYNSGLLSRDEVPTDARYDYAQAPAALIERARRIAAVSAGFGVSLPTAAVHYPLRHPAVQCVVLGSRNALQTNSNIDRLEADVPPQLWVALADEGLIP